MMRRLSRRESVVVVCLGTHVTCLGSWYGASESPTVYSNRRVTWIGVTHGCWNILLVMQRLRTWLVCCFDASDINKSADTV
jgi:hypothetical protein